MSQSQISERMFEFHCWIHGTFHRGDKNGRIEGRLCVRNYVSFENYKNMIVFHTGCGNSIAGTPSTT